MSDDKSHPAVRPDDRRVAMDKHRLEAFVAVITGEVEDDELRRQIAKKEVRFTNKELIWLRDNYALELQTYFEALEFRTAMGWLKPTAVQHKAILSLEQRMGWRNINNGRLPEKMVKRKLDGTEFELEVSVKQKPEAIDAEVVDDGE